MNPFSFVKKRYQITLLILLVIVGAYFLVLQERNTINDSQDTLVPASDSDVSKAKEEKADSKLAGIISAWAAKNSGTYGVMVREVSGAQRFAGYHENERIIAASTYKIFLTYVLFNRIESGNQSLNSKLSDGMTIAECIEPLIVQSSDACAYRMGDLIGWPEIDKFLKDAGFGSTSINNYDAAGNFTNADKYTSAKDEAELVWRLANGSYANKEHTDLLLGYMKRQIWRERIAAGVPKGVEVASKPGFIYDIQNDTGIVYGEKSTYVISILSDKSNPNVLADLSSQVYEYLNR